MKLDNGCFPKTAVNICIVWFHSWSVFLLVVVGAVEAFHEDLAVINPGAPLSADPDNVDFANGLQKSVFTGIRHPAAPLNYDTPSIHG